jgi:hypothetical protein
LLVECAHCETVVDAKEGGTLEVYDPQNDPFPRRYTLLACPRCDEPTLVVQEYIDYQGGPRDWDDPYRVYPPQHKGLSAAAPSELRGAFDEALKCLKARAYTAAAIMCRKTIEGVCVAQGATGRSLRDSLEQLRDGNVIDQRLFQWADALRATGNEAAHGVGVVITKEEAQDMLDFTEAIVDYLFAFQAKFDSFRTRRDESATAQ